MNMSDGPPSIQWHYHFVKKLYFLVFQQKKRSERKLANYKRKQILFWNTVFLKTSAVLICQQWKIILIKLHSKREEIGPLWLKPVSVLIMRSIHLHPKETMQPKIIIRTWFFLQKRLDWLKPVSSSSARFNQKNLSSKPKIGFPAEGRGRVVCHIWLYFLTGHLNRNWSIHVWQPLMIMASLWSLKGKPLTAWSRVATMESDADN